MTEERDPAAIFAMATSLWDECEKASLRDPMLCLSLEFEGMDSLMRLVMDIAMKFEDWACANIDFTRFTDVWPYFLEIHFGYSCLRVQKITNLAQFDHSHCLIMARSLLLPIREQ